MRRSSSCSSIRTIRPSTAQARADGVADAWIEAAKRSPAYKMAVDWKIAFPLHPEYRTLPMVWYVPPLSPIQSHANAGAIETVGEIPDVRSLRIPVRYLANLLTAGAEAPIVTALERMLAMRIYFRQRQLGDGDGQAVLAQAGLTVAQVEEMHRYLAIANYEDRFVIPTSHREAGGGCLRPEGLLRLHLRQRLRLRAAALDTVRRQDGSAQADARASAGHLRRRPCWYSGPSALCSPIRPRRCGRRCRRSPTSFVAAQIVAPARTRKIFSI